MMKLIKKVVSDTSYTVYAVAVNEAKIYAALEEEKLSDFHRVKLLSSNCFLADEYDKLRDFDVVHLAFSRRNRPEADIAGSIDYAQKIFSKVKSLEGNRIIYVSSQGIYGNTTEIRTENTLPAPNSPYTMAKYAVEKILSAYFDEGMATSVRLDSVAQSQNLIYALCRQAKYDGLIQLKGGEQRFSYIDVDDAVSALLSLLQYSGKWKRVYNIGLNGGRINLRRLAEIIAEYSEKETGKSVKIEINSQGIELWAGMDASLFMNDTGWMPKYDIMDIITHIYKTI